MIYTKEEDLGSIIILHIKGDFLFENVEHVEEIWNKYIEKNPEVIAFDFGELDGVDSSALGALIKFFHEAGHKNFKFILYDLTPEVQGLFNISKLNRIFTITTGDSFKEEYLKG